MSPGSATSGGVSAPQKTLVCVGDASQPLLSFLCFIAPRLTNYLLGHQASALLTPSPHLPKTALPQPPPADPSSHASCPLLSPCHRASQPRPGVCKERRQPALGSGGWKSKVKELASRRTSCSGITSCCGLTLWKECPHRDSLFGLKLTLWAEAPYTVATPICSTGLDSKILAPQAQHGASWAQPYLREPELRCTPSCSSLQGIQQCAVPQPQGEARGALCVWLHPPSPSSLDASFYTFYLEESLQSILPLLSIHSS